MFSRAYRRFHKFRMRRKAKKLYPYSDCHYEDNLTVCSCYMCGNPRKYWKEETLQEKKNKYSFKKELLEY